MCRAMFLRSKMWNIIDQGYVAAYAQNCAYSPVSCKLFKLKTC